MALVGGVTQDLRAGDDEQRAEDEQHPPELRDQRGAQPDEDRTQRESAEDAPEQHAVLVLQRNPEAGEEHRPDEHVVDAERLLDDIPREVLAELRGTEGCEHDHREGEAEADPHDRLGERLAAGRLVVVAVPVQVDREHHRDDAEERSPSPERNVDVDELVANLRRSQHGSLPSGRVTAIRKVSPDQVPTGPW